MPEFVFETGITFGNDRGSIIPLQQYKMKTTAKKFNDLSGDLFSVIVKAVEQVSGAPFTYDRLLWIDKPINAKKMSADDRQYLAWSYEPTTPKLVPSDPKEAAQIIVQDILNSEGYGDNLGYESLDGYGSPEAAYDAVDFDAAWAAVTVVAPPVRVPAGTSVYLNGWGMKVFTYLGTLPDDRTHLDDKKWEYAGFEEKTLPVDFVAAQSYTVEAFPLPKDDHRKWFARSKQDKKVEGFGRLKAEAISDVKLTLARKDFWG